MTRVVLVLAAALAMAQPLAAQVPLQLPQPSPAASVSQRIGLTDITITYHRPAVNKRAVWGQLVPYGQVWRAGANENTVISFSTDVSVGGRRVAAGSYGLHMIPTATDWTVILNKQSHAWGSFFYDEKDDALRISTKPRAADFAERLAYTFDDPTDAAVTATMRWEKMAVPIPIAVDVPTTVADSLRTQLTGMPGFAWQSYAQAVTWCVRNDVALEQAKAWADKALALNENFQTLRAKALVTEKAGDAASAKQLRDKAFTVATEADINLYGYTLLQGGKTDEAIAVFRQNVAKHPDSWNVYDSLGEGLAAAGQKGEAAENYRKARAMVKDDTNQKRIDTILAGLTGTK